MQNGILALLEADDLHDAGRREQITSACQEARDPIFEAARVVVIRDLRSWCEPEYGGSASVPRTRPVVKQCNRCDHPLTRNRS